MLEIFGFVYRKVPIKVILLLVVFSLLCSVQIANAEETTDEIQARINAIFHQPSVECFNCPAWWSASKYVVIIRNPQTNYKAIWKFKIAHNRDTFLQLDVSSKKKRVKGDIMLISGRAMLTRGLTLDPEYRMDALDEAALWLQLAIRILDRAFPGGPTSVVGFQPIKATHDTKGIHVNTSGATGDFSPPWKATGKANRKDNSTIDFDLNFFWHMKAKPQQKSSQLSKLTGKVNRKISISGLWQKNDNAILPDDMSLNGWEFSSGIKFSNLGQLRAYINDQTQHAKQR